MPYAVESPIGEAVFEEHGRLGIGRMSLRGIIHAPREFCVERTNRREISRR